MNAILPRLIAGRGDNAALIRLPPNDDGFPSQLGPVQQFDRDEKRVHIDM